MANTYRRYCWFHRLYQYKDWCANRYRRIVVLEGRYLAAVPQNHGSIGTFMFSNYAKVHPALKVVRILRALGLVIRSTNMGVSFISRLAADFLWKVLPELIFVIRKDSMLEIITGFLS